MEQLAQAIWSQERLIETIVQIVAIIAAAFVATRLLRKAVNKVEKKVAANTAPVRMLQRTETLTKVMSSAGIVITWGVALLMTLQALQFNLAPLLAGVGIVGLAVGFGAQNLVRDVVTGFFILFEDQYGVGDLVMINEVASGKVEKLTLRVTGLRDLDGTMHFMPNGEITHVANRSKDWARAIVDVGVGYSEDPSHVRKVLESVAEEVKQETDGVGRLLYEVPQVLGVEMLGEYEVVWRIICETRPGKQFECARVLRERIKVAFDREEIEIPFPHRVMITPNGPARRPDKADVD